MINRHQEKMAFAEGYHAGMNSEPFDNPYEDFDLRVQYGAGYRTASDRIEAFINEHNQEYA